MIARYIRALRIPVAMSRASLERKLSEQKKALEIERGLRAVAEAEATLYRSMVKTNENQGTVRNLV